MIPIPGTVIYRVGLLEKCQPELGVFTDFRGRLIGDGDFELTGVDVVGDENDIPLKIKIKMILNIKRIKRSSILSSGTKSFNNPSKLELDPLEKVPTKIAQVP